jgi:hypothetical protein
MRLAAIDADIFFFSISQKSESLTKRDKGQQSEDQIF